MLIGICSVVGCETQEAASDHGKTGAADVRRNIGKAAETTAEFAHQTKEEFEEKMHIRLKDLDVQIVTLRQKGHNLEGEIREKWARCMANLESKRDIGQLKLSEVQKSGAEAWKELRKDTQTAWKDIDNAAHEASREF